MSWGKIFLYADHFLLISFFWPLKKSSKNVPSCSKISLLLKQPLDFGASTFSATRERGKIEVFFKPFRQKLKTEMSFGTSEHALQTQIWTVMWLNIDYST
jgi:hypothetical protein